MEFHSLEKGLARPRVFEANFRGTERMGGTHSYHLCSYSSKFLCQPMTVMIAPVLHVFLTACNFGTARWKISRATQVLFESIHQN